MEASTRVVIALGRLKDIFLEFPDTLLSIDDASNLLALEPHQCHALLSALEDVRFLQRGPEGTYRLRATVAA
jgi:DNA-binding IclR family transcriptional regulator